MSTFLYLYSSGITVASICIQETLSESYSHESKGKTVRIETPTSSSINFQALDMSMIDLEHIGQQNLHVRCFSCDTYIQSRRGDDSETRQFITCHALSARGSIQNAWCVHISWPLHPWESRTDTAKCKNQILSVAWSPERVREVEKKPHNI